MKTGDIVEWVNGMGITLTGTVVELPSYEGGYPLVRESRLGTMLRPRNVKVTRSGDTYGGPTGYAGDSTAPPERGTIMTSYTPSDVVKAMIIEIADSTRGNRDFWSEYEQGVSVGTRHGMNLFFRLAVETETKITDPDDLDELCAELITDYLINKA